jgi:chain length determinant protein (polysaccharide antigen chain regulator)
MSQEIKQTEERTRQYLILDPDLIQRNTASEISLFDLWAILSRKRILILGILGGSLAISATIAFLITPIYKATIHFAPPLDKDIAALNIPGVSSGYTTDGVYKAFQNNFRARNNLWEFFIEKHLYKAYPSENADGNTAIGETFERKFAKDITLNQPNGEQPFTNATLNWKDANEGAALLNEYSQTVITKTLAQYVDELSNTLLLDKERLQDDIKLIRESAQRKKEYYLSRLDENISIAKALGIKRRHDMGEMKTPDIFVPLSGTQPLYYEGYETLEAEKRSLQIRKDNDPFIPELTEKLKTLEFLNSVNVSANLFTVVRVTQQARASDKPIKPNKKLIVVLGSILGLFIGILAAFVAYALQEGGK